MRTTYDPDLGAQITFDDENRVRNITYLEPSAPEPGLQTLGGAEADTQTARDVAVAYVEKIAPLLQVPSEQLESLGESPAFDAPQERSVQYRVAQEKTLFDATTVGFAQTVHEIPVWESGISVLVKHDPYRVVSAEHNPSENEPDPKLPPPAVIERYQSLFAIAEAERGTRDAAESEDAPQSQTADFVRRVFGVANDVYLIRGRFFIYRYDPEKRLPKPEASESGEEPAKIPFDLPPVPPSIVPWQYYMVAEVTFSHRGLVWLALIELETEAVLHLRPMFASVNGMVFLVDPLTATGVATNTADRPNTVLNPLRTSVVLPNLVAPANGTQALRGARAKLTNRHPPPIAAPTRPTGQAFDYDVRSNDFAAVSAYYHVEQFFRTVEGLGFDLSQYFNGTTFPIDVDHRAAILTTDGIEINAHCDTNGVGGIGHLCFALGDLTDTANPLGRACDSRVFWHELGGHGVLYEFVNSPNFKFAHSAGDSLSAIFHDPDSRAPDRRRYAPWNVSNERRNNRAVGDGWAWDGPEDQKKGYFSEEILATTMFRAYLSIGGQSTDRARRVFASRMMMYLILRAIGSLTPQTNPDHAMKFANALIAADLLDWTTVPVVAGGAYGKVIRWAFEKQGLYQPPGAPAPFAVRTEGAPPDVDVYIDDGRRGEYQFQPNHANTAAIWNRLAADGRKTHQRPKLGVSNHAYVKIKNRGPKIATGVRVRGFHSRGGAGRIWPADFQPMTTAAIAVGTLAGNNTATTTVGPFEWTPVANGSGEDAMLMIVTAAEDPSNADLFTGKSIEDWRLVPNDNGIGQRNVRPIP